MASTPSPFRSKRLWRVSPIGQLPTAAPTHPSPLPSRFFGWVISPSRTISDGAGQGNVPVPAGTEPSTQVCSQASRKARTLRRLTPPSGRDRFAARGPCECPAGRSRWCRPFPPPWRCAQCGDSRPGTHRSHRRRTGCLRARSTTSNRSSRGLLGLFCLWMRRSDPLLAARSCWASTAAGSRRHR